MPLSMPLSSRVPRTLPSPLPASTPQALWCATDGTEMRPFAIETAPSGFHRLDSELPGVGWPAGMLTELIAREPDTTALQLLVPLLRGLTRRGRTVILLAPPGSIGVPALADFGIDLKRLSIVPARNAADRLWAIEGALRAPGFGTLLAWLPQDRCRPEHLRRLHAAAQIARGPVFLFRELPAQFQPSPAPLRLLLLARPQRQLSVQVLKRRGPVLVRPIVLDLPKPMAAIRLSSSSARGPAPSPVRGQAIRILPLDAQGPFGAIRSTASVITPSRPPARNSATRSGSLIV